MSKLFESESMLDMFIFETSQLIEQLEQCILTSEKESCFTDEAINEIFRIMHTIKGSAAMMMFNNIATLAHSMEDLFYYLRDQNPAHVDCSALSDLVLEGVDFIKVEMEKIKNRDAADGDASALIANLTDFLAVMKQNNSAPLLSNTTENTGNLEQPFPDYEEASIPSSYNYKAVLFFEEGCGMEAIRAFSVIHNLKEITAHFAHIPEDLNDSAGSEEKIRQEGFTVYFKSDLSYEMLQKYFMQTPFLKKLELTPLAINDASNHKMS